MYYALCTVMLDYTVYYHQRVTLFGVVPALNLRIWGNEWSPTGQPNVILAHWDLLHSPRDDIEEMSAMTHI